MFVQPIRMEGFIPIFSLILIDLKFIVEQSEEKSSSPEQTTQQRRRKMNSVKNVYELIDFSSSEDERDFVERSSTPLPREAIPNYRVILENSLSSAEAVADEEEYFDVSADSLEASYKRIKLNSSLASIDSNSHPQQEGNDEAQTSEGIPDSPESPDESMSSDLFIVEEANSNEGSISSSKVAEYLEKVNQEDSSSYFITPLGTPRKINFGPASPLNDLEVRRSFVD